ncbi:MAG: hypothetical protein ABI346_01160 [Candidatus Baltobacteraceae bacterium]
MIGATGGPVQPGAADAPSPRAGADKALADADDDAAPAAPAEPKLDTAESTSDEVARRAERLLVRAHLETEANELQLDRIRKDFDMHEQERAEYVREWNAIRDLAMEQMKHDDEILKKFIALI